MSKVLGLIVILFFVVSSCEKSKKVETGKKEEKRETVFKGESIHKSLGSIKRARKTVNKLNERVKASERETDR